MWIVYVYQLDNCIYVTTICICINDCVCIFAYNLIDLKLNICNCISNISLSLYTTQIIHYNLCLYKARKRERQKRLGQRIYNFKSNCIKREREKDKRELGRGIFLLYNFKCIGRIYMYLHVYIQFSHALYKQKHNLYISLLFV